MINIRLSDSVFNLGGIYYNTPRNRASLILGAGRNDLVVGKRNSYQQSSLDYFGFQTGLYITTRGCEIENNMLECLTQDPLYRSSYGAQLIDYHQRGIIEIAQDGALLTPDQVIHYTAP